MAVRIQFRRGTAAEWSSANPTLAVGELGYETDNQQFKIGDGTNDWANLAYAAVSTNYVDNAIANVVGLAPETLDTLNELAASIGDDADFATTVSSNIANAVSDHSDTTLSVHGIANTAALETTTGAQQKADAAQSNAQSYADSAIADLIDSSPGTLDTLNELAAALGDDPNFSTTVTNTLANKISVIFDSSSNFETANALSTANILYVTTDLGRSYARFGDGVNSYNDLPVIGQYYADEAINTFNEVTTDVHGISDTTDLAYQSDISTHSDVTENVHGITNTAALVIDTTFNAHVNATTNVHGIADTSDLVVTADLDAYATLGGPTFTGTVVLPSDTSIGGVSSTEIGYLTNVTSDIQNQLDLKADLTDPVFSNSVSLPAETSIGDVNPVEIARLANVSANIQDQLDAKLASNDAAAAYAPLTNPTFSGTVALPSSTSIGDVSSTELGYIANVTSDVQSQLDAKLESSDVSSTYSPIASPTFTGTVTLPGDTIIGDITSTELSYITNVTSDIQGQLDDKLAITDAANTYAPLNGATLTGNVVLPASTTIGDITSTELSYLTNVTSDIQAQLGGKLGVTTASTTYAPLAGATLTGTVSLPATTSIGDVSATEIGYLNNVSSAIQTQLNDKAPIESPTFTGTVSGVTASMVGLSNVDNTSDLGKPVSNATQNALDAKLDLAGGTMTGKITLDGDPTQALHAVTKQYVDSVEAGLLTRPSVKAATTTNLSGTYDNGTAGLGATLNLGQLATLDIDGVTSWDLLDGILVKDQTDKAENGRYVVDQLGNDVDTDWILRRCSLCDTADEIPGSYIFVLDGTTNEQTGWVQHVADPETFTVGTDDIDVYQFAGAGAITAGTNISVSGNEVSVIAAPTFTDKVTVSANGIEFSDGTIQTEAGVPSLTAFTEKTASYTLDTLDHKDNVVEMNSGSALTFTIPTNATLAWPIGASMDIIQTGAGQVTIANAIDVTLNFTPGNKLRTQWSSCTIMKRGADSWILYGDLTA